jgi:uncharacterized protein YecE (DUF72 family)
MPPSAASRPRSDEPTPPPGLHIGCAGWGLPAHEQGHFPASGTHLTRYAARLSAVEINSSFYRPHRAATYERWAASVPAGFLFSVKVPRALTHDQRLTAPAALLDRFCAEVAGLGPKLGCLLVQLPPSLAFDRPVAARFFKALRARTAVDVVCEPRHPSWFGASATALLAAHGVGRVAADPAPTPGAADPGASREVIYRRLHGSPRIYYSTYDEAHLDRLAAQLRQDLAAGARAWCIFDNTALGAATANALGLLGRI